MFQISQFVLDLGKNIIRPYWSETHHSNLDILRLHLLCMLQLLCQHLRTVAAASRYVRRHPPGGCRLYRLRDSVLVLGALHHVLPVDVQELSHQESLDQEGSGQDSKDGSTYRHRNNRYGCRCPQIRHQCRCGGHERRQMHPPMMRSSLEAEVPYIRQVRAVDKDNDRNREGRKDQCLVCSRNLRVPFITDLQ